MTHALAPGRPTVTRVQPTTRAPRGFTLIELMTVVVILGILATIAVMGFSKYTRNARKSQVVSDLSNITLRQKSFLAVTGHYASSTTDENLVYPLKADISDPSKVPVQWNITDAGYTLNGQPDGPYLRGGGARHGFDALRFMPEGGQSYCSYGTISGYGSNAPAGENDEPPFGQTLAAAIFPNGTPEEQRFYGNDWFYSFAICDLDFDKTYWALTTAHYTSDVSSGPVGPYRENE